MTDAQIAYMGNSSFGQPAFRTLPIIQPPPSIRTTAPSPGSPMDVNDATPPASAMMGPPSRTSPEETNGAHEHMGMGMGMGMGDQLAPGHMAGPNAAAAAAAGSQQPKVVQTAFIHKLYK